MGSQRSAYPNLGGRIVTIVIGRIVTILRRQLRYEGTGREEISLRVKLLAAVLIVTLLAVYYILGMDYINQRRERDTLAFQFDTATQTLDQMSDSTHNLEDLEQWLEAAEERLADEQSVFPSRLNSTAVISSILALADSLGVNAIPLVTQSWLTEVVGESNYDVLRLTVAAEGTFGQMVNFVSRLEEGEYQTLVVENLTVQRVTPLVGEEAGAGAPVIFIASFDLAIYAQSQNSD